MLVDMYTPRMVQELDNLTPEQFCLKTRMCRPSRMILDQNDCATCQFVILEIKIKLQDPKTQVRHRFRVLFAQILSFTQLLVQILD